MATLCHPSLPEQSFLSLVFVLSKALHHGTPGLVYRTSKHTTTLQAHFRQRCSEAIGDRRQVSKRMAGLLLPVVPALWVLLKSALRLHVDYISIPSY